MKIYTKKGDQGQTFLFGGGPFPKDDARIETYGTIDELNSIVGCAISLLEAMELAPTLLRIQEELFVAGAELATINPDAKLLKGFLNDSHTRRLENEIDAWEKELEPLKKFILPGGSKASAFLHQARTVSRRAERHLVGLSRQQNLRAELLVYFNRLSDWLFVLARLVNHREGKKDILWEGILK